MEHGLRPRDITATVVSAMIGAGIFLTPGLLLRQGAPPLVIITLFAIAGVTVLLGAWTLADLAVQMPGNGGPYRYLSQRLGPTPGFLYNWSRFWVMQCGALAVLGLTAVRFAADAAGVDPGPWLAPIAALVVAAAAWLNSRGLGAAAATQAVLTFLKLATITALAIGILWAAQPGGLTAPREADLTGGWGSWILLSIFAFGGWTQVTFLAGEAEPSRLRKAIAAGVLLATGIYLVALVSMFLAGPLPGQVIAAEAAGEVFGSVGRRIVAAIIALAVLGTLHTMTLTGPRLYQAAAADGHWWKPFARANKHGAPGHALLYQALWAGYLIALSRLAEDAFVALIGGISTAIWLFHALTAAAWLRGGGTIKRWVPIAFLAASLVVLGLAIAQDVRLIIAGQWASLTAFWALMIVASGLPFRPPRPRTPTGPPGPGAAPRDDAPPEGPVG